jgi:hypothetical protein
MGDQQGAQRNWSEPDARERFGPFGYQPLPLSPEELKAVMSAESAKYADIVKRANISCHSWLLMPLLRRSRDKAILVVPSPCPF